MKIDVYCLLNNFKFEAVIFCQKNYIFRVFYGLDCFLQNKAVRKKEYEINITIMNEKLLLENEKKKTRG